MLTVGLETLQRCCRVCGTFLRTLDILISELFSWRKVKSRKTQVSQYGSLYESPRNLHCEWRWFSVWLFLKARRNDRYPHRRRVYRFSCLNILHVIGIALVFTLPFAFVLCCLFFPVFFFCQMVGRVILETTVSPPPLKKKIRSKDTRFVLLWGRCSDRKSQNWALWTAVNKYHFSRYTWFNLSMEHCTYLAIYLVNKDDENRAMKLMSISLCPLFLSPKACIPSNNVLTNVSPSNFAAWSRTTIFCYGIIYRPTIIILLLLFMGKKLKGGVSELAIFAENRRDLLDGTVKNT